MGTERDRALASFESVLDAGGLGLRASLPVDAYDARVPEVWRSARRLPEARSALVIGSGGRALWDALRRAPEASREDPVDAFTRRVVGQAVAGLEAAGVRTRAWLAFESCEGVYVDLVGLAARAGLGAPSRLGLLVHPVYGPWLSLRALVLSEACWPRQGSQAPAGYDPCSTCPAPCETACPGGAPSSRGFDVLACGRQRRRDADCAEACAARRACVLGPEHAYAADALAHHMRHARLP